MRSLFNHYTLNRFIASVVLPLLFATGFGLTAQYLTWPKPTVIILALFVVFTAFGVSIEQVEEQKALNLAEHTGRLLLAFLIPVACIAASLRWISIYTTASIGLSYGASGGIGLASFLMLISRLFARSSKPPHFRGRSLIEFSAAEQKARRMLKRGDPGIQWGGLRIPSHAATQHFFVGSVSGGGKTLTLRLLMQSVLPAIKPGSDCRALVYDAKQDVLGLLAGMGISARLVILNPFDTRCHAWDIAKDVTGPAIARQVAEILIPSDKNASQPFFTESSRHLLYGVMVAFIQTAGENWTFSDVVIALRSKERIEQILSRTPETRELIDLYFSIPERISDIIATIASKMAPFECIAAAWSYATEKVSLRAWLSGEFILVLGNDEATRSALQAVNQVLFKRISELILSQSESETRRTWIILDEARQAGYLDGLNALLTNGRSKGAAIALGAQDLEGMQEVYGAKVANEILGQCSTKAILRLASPATAEWASKLFGPFEKLEKRTSESQGTSASGKSSGSTKSEQIAQRPAVLESEFYGLPPTNPKFGLSGFYLQPDIGAYKATLTGKWIATHLCKPNPKVPNFIPRPEEQQYLPAWTEEDLKRLGLDQPIPPTVQLSQPTKQSTRAKKPGRLNTLKGFTESA